MSVPTLTPAETAIFDDDVIEDLEEHYDDDLTCVVDGCDAPAEVAATARCCNHTDLICERHYWAGRRAIEAHAVICLLAHVQFVCIRCRHKFPYASTFDDMVRVVMPI